MPEDCCSGPPWSWYIPSYPNGPYRASQRPTGAYAPAACDNNFPARSLGRSMLVCGQARTSCYGSLARRERRAALPTSAGVGGVPVGTRRI